MRSFRQVINAAFLLLSLAIAWASWQLKFSVRGEVGPGLMPFGAAVLLGVVSLVGFVQTMRGAPESTLRDLIPSRNGALRILAIIAALIATIVLLDPLGFVLTTFAMLALLPFALGVRKVTSTLLMAAAASFSIYFAFTNLLRVPLPAGVLGF